MSDNLKQKAAKGILWKFLGSGGTQVILFLSGIYIARLLSPDDYGLVGMMAIFMGISNVFIDSGFRATLIQRANDITYDHYNVVFIFNIAVSTIIYLLIFLSAPLIAKFYDEPRLLPIARVLGANLIIISLGLIHQTILEKDLKFQEISKIRIGAVSVSVIVGIIIAKLDFGVWALVYMRIIESFTFTLSLWIINSWYPAFSFNKTVFKELYNKSIQVFMSGILNATTENTYPLIIGKLFSTADVGFYTQGKKLQNSIRSFINTSMQSVMYPVQSLMKGDMPRLKNAVRRNVNLTTLISFPAMIGLVVLAKPFILVSLTEKWISSTYYIQILSIASVMGITKVAINSYIMALGKFKLSLFFGILRTALLLIIVLVGIVLSLKLKQLVLALLVTEALGFVWVFYFASKILNYRFKEIMKDISLALIFSLVMAFAVYLMSTYMKISFIALLAQVISGGVIYLLLNYTINHKLFIEIKEVVKIWKKK